MTVEVEVEKEHREASQEEDLFMSIYQISMNKEAKDVQIWRHDGLRWFRGVHGEVFVWMFNQPGI